MAKRKYVIDDDKIARYIKEGRGQGSGANYKPWLTIHDVPSEGRVHRPTGWKTKRVHHFLSDIEYRHFLLLDWADEVTDIREQFPLDLDRTKEISHAFGIPHPIVPGSGNFEVMTTDFLVVLGEGETRRLIAWAIKPAEKLSDARVIEKLEIERRYWVEQTDVQWYISTERELPMARVEALDWMRGAWDLEDIREPREGYIAELMHRLVSIIGAHNESDRKLNAACTGLDERHDATPGAHLLVARHLLARRVFQTDIDRKKLWEVPLRDIRVDEVAFRELMTRDASNVAYAERAA